jgi:hypothetical protein
LPVYTLFSASARRDGSHKAVIAPANDSTDATELAAANPRLKSSALARLPSRANAATVMATPNAPPSYRIMLSTPDALPICEVATALTTLFCTIGIAIAKPAPAAIIGATMVP